MRRRTNVQLGLAVVLALTLAFGLARSAAAVEIRTGDIVTISPDEVIDDDLLLSGNQVVVNGIINGDLIVAGNEVTINGTVNGSLVMAGQSVTLNGKVTGSLYAGGAALQFGPEASVGRNLFFGGFGLKAEPGSRVGRDLLMGGYQALLDGEVGRDVKVSLGALELNGAVGGDVMADVSQPEATAPEFGPSFFMPGLPPMIAPGLRVGPEASIGGKLTYTSAVEQADGIQVEPEGGVVYQTPQPGEQPPSRVQPRVSIGFDILGWFLARGRELITLLIFGAVMVWKLPVLLNTVTDKARTQTLPAAGWGLVVVIVGYVGAFILGAFILALGIVLGIVTLGGLSETVFGVGFSALGLATTVFTFLVSYGSKLVVAYLVSLLIVRSLTPQYSENKAVVLIVGVVLYVIVRGIPLLGWFIGVAATLVGVGAMWLVFRERRMAAPTPASSAPAPTA